MTSQAGAERFDIAVIGMSGRFPGAKSLQEFWQNLDAGIESIKNFSKEELLQRGVSPQRLSDPTFVGAGAPVPDAELFAAAFFGCSPREAELMDPQHRLFLECAWSALEDAGYAPRSLEVPAGVFAGTSLSTYMLFNLAGDADAQEDEFQAMIGSDKDFLSTRVSYKLNLKGPSITVQSGCSTSLTAIHLAIQSLLTYQCDVAIAGGVSVGVPQRTGYIYQTGGILSPDGHCRAFDAEAAGTIFGEGVGVVVLKRMEDALNDRDNIHAVVLGSAINNDGAAKIGYTAPGVQGQSEVIARAHAVAGIRADAVSYVEAHGTGTELGDLVEVMALAKAFSETGGTDYCGIGSVKSNIGHLDAAAGVAGFLKTILMLKHKRLAPSLHYKIPNPKINFADTPFRVISETADWKSSGVRRAGVSSFGIGGTNVHLVLEEAPPIHTASQDKPYCILGFSAQTPTALEQATSDFLERFQNAPEARLVDIAYTLHTGREAFKFRKSILCSDVAEAFHVLQSNDPALMWSGTARNAPLKICFLFPGGGTQYPNMGRQLYETEPVYQQEIKRCAAFLQKHHDIDLIALVYPSICDDTAAARLRQPSLGLPAIFATEYSLAKLLMSWGISPACMVGHSLGEYTAACLSGVLSLEDALALVAFRGILLEKLPAGSMLSVSLPESETRALLQGGLSIAAINAPNQSVISGPAREIDSLAHKLEDRKVEFRRLHIEAAAHSILVEPVLDQFKQFLGKITWNPPSVPYLSNLTGRWIATEQVMDPLYWVNHFRQTVRFADGIGELLQNQNEDMAFIEVGPARVLSTLVKANASTRGVIAHACMPHPQEPTSEVQMLYGVLARLWNQGLIPDWKTFYAAEHCRRVSLPTYPFERQRYWLNPNNEGVKRAYSRKPQKQKQTMAYIRRWEAQPLALDSKQQTKRSYIILQNQSELGKMLGEILGRHGAARVITSEIGIHARDDRTDGKFWSYEFESVLDQLRLEEDETLTVIYLPAFTENLKDSVFGNGLHSEWTDNQNLVLSAVPLLKRLAQLEAARPIRFFLVSDCMLQVSGNDPVLPQKSALLAACRALHSEYPQFLVSAIDVSVPNARPMTLNRVAIQIVDEVTSETEEGLIAYRGLRRWRPVYISAEWPQLTSEVTLLKEGGIYLITGGLGEIGPGIGISLARRCRCMLIFTARTPFPRQTEWNEWIQSHTDDDKTTRTIQKLQQIRELGCEVATFATDVSNESEMLTLIDEIYRKFGKLNGVLHLAGITGNRALRLIPDLSTTECLQQFAPKIGGCNALGHALENRPLDFCVLFSSTASLLGGAGMTAYAAANGFLDAYADQHKLRTGQKWITIQWDAWLTQAAPDFLGHGRTALDRFAVTEEEALSMLHHILNGGGEELYIISKGDLEIRVKETVRYSLADIGAAPGNPEICHDRPDLSAEYAPPVTELQQKIAAVWGEILGIAKVGIHDNFFELGGDSLRGLRIVSRLKAILNLEIPATTLFTAPTILALSRTLSQPSAPVDYQDSRNRGELRRRALQSRAG